MPDAVNFHDIDVARPDYDQLAASYRQLEDDFSAAETVDQRIHVVGQWNDIRRDLNSWVHLTQLRFHQDTRNEDYKREQEFCDQIQPKLTGLEVGMKRMLVGSPHRTGLEQRLGAQAFALWESEIVTYEPVIEDDLIEEARLENEYTELLAAAKFEVDNETYNLSGLGRFREHPDRPTRERTERLRWNWFDENRESLDRIYGDLVRLRTRMARKLGFENFVGLGYKRMCRVDYTEQDVDRFRAQVREHVVPLAQTIRDRQRTDLGVEKLMFWDEALHDLQGNPAPLGDHDWMIERAQEMFDAMSDELGAFFRLMTNCNLMDLKNRDGKAGGGFCTAFPRFGVPYIFANFNGTKGDVEVFTHEIGHAFQSYLSRNQPLVDYLWPTYESCEIHSMGLEFLTSREMERFFGDRAERFRRIHLIQSLLFLPYGVAVDHFQHLVYASPDATPAERFAMWQEMERTYLPWRDYADLPHASAGGMWQLQRHIYGSPFYYIDYTLAQTCALQFWVKSEQDFDSAMATYVALCRRGGEAPFRELARSAGLISPFEDGCLSGVVEHASKVIMSNS